LARLPQLHVDDLARVEPLSRFGDDDPAVSERDALDRMPEPLARVGVAAGRAESSPSPSPPSPVPSTDTRANVRVPGSLGTFRVSVARRVGNGFAVVPPTCFWSGRRNCAALTIQATG